MTSGARVRFPAAVSSTAVQGFLRGILEQVAHRSGFDCGEDIGLRVIRGEDEHRRAVEFTHAPGSGDAIDIRHLDIADDDVDRGDVAKRQLLHRRAIRALQHHVNVVKGVED